MLSGTKSPLRSLGIMGPIAGLIVWGANQLLGPGVIDDATVSEAIDAGATLFAVLTGVIGRWRATQAVAAKKS